MIWTGGQNLSTATETLVKRRVSRGYTRVYTDPIAIQAGDPLTLGLEDDEYPGWIWCTDPHGRSGWAPLAIINRDAAVALEDYSAAELSAAAGEVLVVEREESGWAFCRNAAGERGWLPLANLADD
jgi:hypothetical protein